MSEQKIVKAVVEALNCSGLAKVWRNQSGCVKVAGGFMHLAPKGSPDIIGYTLRGARFIGIEVKRPKGYTNPDQVKVQTEWREKLLAAGAIAGQVTSVDEAIELVRGARTEVA